MNHPRWRFGLSVLLTFCVAGSAIRLADRHDRRLDCTTNRRFTLDWVSRAILDDLKDDVRATAVQPLGGDPDAASSLRLLLESFRRASPRFTYRFASLASGLISASVDPRRATVILEAAGRREIVDSPDEAGIVSGLLRLVRRGPRDVVFLVGHGERSIRDTSPDGASRAADELRQAGFEPRQELWMRVGDALPDSAAGIDGISRAASAPPVLVLAGPRMDLSPAERARLATHLDHGGGVLLMLDPRALPEVESLVRDWGILPGRGVLVDPTTRLYGADATVPVVTDYADHPITASLTRGGTVPTFFPVARALRVDPTPPRHRRVEVIASASGRAAERAMDGSSVPGPAESSSPRGEPPGVVVAVEGPSGARLVVVGDSDFASNGNLSLSGNATLLSGAIEWLSAGKDPLPVRPRGEVPLLLTERQFRQRVTLPSLALPVLAVLTGVLTARRGRRA